MRYRAGQACGDLRARYAIADFGVHRVGEINRSLASWKPDHLAMRREDLHLFHADLDRGLLRNSLGSAVWPVSR